MRFSTLNSAHSVRILLVKLLTRTDATPGAKAGGYDVPHLDGAMIAVELSCVNTDVRSLQKVCADARVVFEGLGREFEVVGEGNVGMWERGITEGGDRVAGHKRWARRLPCRFRCPRQNFVCATRCRLTAIHFESSAAFRLSSTMAPFNVLERFQYTLRTLQPMFQRGHLV